MKSRNSNLGYHLVAFVTVAIWGSTFVFTKMLLQSGLTPAQIFTLRFTIAYVLLLAFSVITSPPKFFAEQSGKAERGGVRGGLNIRSSCPELLPSELQRCNAATAREEPNPV